MIRTGFIFLIAITISAVDASVHLFQANTPYNHQKTQDDNILNAYISVLKKASSQIELNEDILNDLSKDAVPLIRLQKKSQDDQDRLLTQFSPDQVKEFLNKHQLSVWQAPKRPTTLFWLMEAPNDKHHAVLYTSTDEAITHPFISQMSDYGFLAYLPMDDIENQKITQILSTTINNQTLHHLQQTYGVDAILIGQYSSIDTFTDVKWTLFSNTSQIQWRDKAHHKDDLSQRAIKHLINQYRVMYQPQSREEHVFTVTIEPIHHYASIQKIQQLLNNINQTRDSSVKKIKDHRIELAITWQGNEEQLQAAINALPLALEPVGPLHFALGNLS